MTAGVELVLPWADRADSSCFGCAPDNPVGLGLRFRADGPDGLVTDVCLGTRYESYPGVVHGGLLALVCDEAMGNLAVLRTGQAAVTTTLRLRYLGTVHPGVAHRCHARVEGSAPGPLRGHAELRRVDDGTTVVVATAAYLVARPGSAAADAVPVPPAPTPPVHRGDQP